MLRVWADCVCTFKILGSQNDKGFMLLLALLALMSSFFALVAALTMNSWDVMTCCCRAGTDNRVSKTDVEKYGNYEMVQQSLNGWMNLRALCIHYLLTLFIYQMSCLSLSPLFCSMVSLVKD